MRSDTIRKRPSELSKDKKVLDVLKSVVGYNPANDGLSIESLEAIFQEMEALKKLEEQKIAECKGIRDDLVKAEHAFHKAILGAKNQVRAQFGEDSNEIQGLGIKKKSEYKKPKRRTAG